MAKGKFGGMGGGMNMQAMIKHAQKMQQEMLRAQEEMAQTETEATAGGGAVKAVVLGTTSSSLWKSRRRLSIRRISRCFRIW